MHAASVLRINTGIDSFARILILKQTMHHKYIIRIIYDKDTIAEGNKYDS